jgi:hypothetical protein
MKKLMFALTRPAKHLGGDRYETMLPGEDRPMVIYVPQNISRPAGAAPVKGIEVTFMPIAN